MSPLRIAKRRGSPPQTTDWIPHRQISDNPDTALFEATRERFLALEGADIGPTKISVPGAIARFVPIGCSCNPAGMMIDREYAHIHPAQDGSFHMILGEDDCAHVLEQGWGELHPYVKLGKAPAGTVMIYAPRDEAEIETVLAIAAASHRFATAEPVVG